MSRRANDIMDELMRIAATAISEAGYPARVPRTRIELDGVTVGQLVAALRFSGLALSNSDGVLVIHVAQSGGTRA